MRIPSAEHEASRTCAFGNRNIIPWWLLLPQGVSGAIKKRAGYQPFREVAKYGLIPLGGAVFTSAGRLPFKGIIHVAGISMWWRASEYSIRESCRNAIRIARELSFASVAFPLIGAGTGGGTMAEVERLMMDQLGMEEYSGRIVVVQYKK